ncbi:MAG TPA: lipopolysaccharide heptosyltransferase II [Casimicrobiaceae bacterium]|nr:lipopolysaccharide heptosyltransferase II [Casimicrobiaceae bacterium]
MAERTLVVAPSWVGDAILTEPLIARLRELHGEHDIDVLTPAWCAPVFARMRGVRRVVESTLRHGEIGWSRRLGLARALRNERFTRAIVLPNSWKSALIPWLARIPQRTGYRGEQRWGLINDMRRFDGHATPRLVDRYAALATPPGEPPRPAAAPVLVPNLENRSAQLGALALDVAPAVAIFCPGAEYGPAKRWPAEQFAELAQKFLAARMRVWLIGSPNDRTIGEAIVESAGAAGSAIVDLTGRTDLGTAVDLLSLASIVVSNDSGLMHAAAAVGAPLVALFGSSSPAYTPPMSADAKIARIEIECSPCFRRECPLGHFKCMRELSPATVYDLARSALDRASSVADIPRRN